MRNQNQMQRVEIEERGSNWIVRVIKAGGSQMFCCPDRQIALRFAAVFEGSSEPTAMAA